MQEDNLKNDNLNTQSQDNSRKPRKRNRLFGIGCGIRAIGCGCFLLIILIIIGIVFFFVSKPAGLWTFAVNFLNDGITVSSYPKLENGEQVKQEINNQVTSIGTTTLQVTQEQLTSLLREKYPDLKNLYSYISKEKISIYWEVENTIKNTPLQANIELKTDSNNKLSLTKFGTVRVPIPYFLNSYLTSIFNILASTTPSTTEDKYAFLTNLISANNLKITNITLDDSNINIKADVKVNLFN